MKCKHAVVVLVATVGFSTPTRAVNGQPAASPTASAVTGTKAATNVSPLLPNPPNTTSVAAQSTVAEAPRALPLTPVSPEIRAAPKLVWQMLGVLRVKAAVVQNDPNVTFVGRADGFELQHARLGVHAQFGNTLAARLSVEGAVDERNGANDPNGEIRVGLKDALFDVALGEFGANRANAREWGSELAGLAVRAGRFAILMDVEEYAGLQEQLFVSRSLASRGVRATEGWQTPSLLPGRSLGVAIRKEPRKESGLAIGFEVAAQNGADEFASNNDNDSVALSASVVVQLPARGQLIAAVRYNPRTVGKLPLLQNETDIQGAIGGSAVVGPLRLGAGVTVQRTTFATTDGVAQLGWAGHGHAMYELPLARPLGFGYRFGLLDSSSLVLTDRVMEHTLGVNWQLPAARLRLQLNATHVVEQADRTLSNDRVEAVVEVTL